MGEKGGEKVGEIWGFFRKNLEKKKKIFNF